MSSARACSEEPLKQGMHASMSRHIRDCADQSAPDAASGECKVMSWSRSLAVSCVVVKVRPRRLPIMGLAVTVERQGESVKDRARRVRRWSCSKRFDLADA